MAQALARERLGFQRFPLVTAVVFTATAATSIGVLAERLAGRGWWLAAYFGAWLAGEPAGADA
jgi:hypothetical protein